MALHFWSAAMISYDYPPLHILRKGGRTLPTEARVAMLLMSGAVGLHMLRTVWRARSLDVYASLRLCWLGLFTPLGFLAIADLFVVRNGQLALWAGANYFVPPLALGVTLLGLRLVKRNA